MQRLIQHTSRGLSSITRRSCLRSIKRGNSNTNPTTIRYICKYTRAAIGTEIPSLTLSALHPTELNVGRSFETCEDDDGG